MTMDIAPPTGTALLTTWARLQGLGTARPDRPVGGRGLGPDAESSFGLDDNEAALASYNARLAALYGRKPNGPND